MYKTIIFMTLFCMTTNTFGQQSPRRSFYYGSSTASEIHQRNSARQLSRRMNSFPVRVPTARLYASSNRNMTRNGLQPRENHPFGGSQPYGNPYATTIQNSPQPTSEFIQPGFDQSQSGTAMTPPVPMLDGFDLDRKAIDNHGKRLDNDSKTLDIASKRIDYSKKKRTFKSVKLEMNQNERERRKAHRDQRSILALADGIVARSATRAVANALVNHSNSELLNKNISSLSGKNFSPADGFNRSKHTTSFKGGNVVALIKFMRKNHLRAKPGGKASRILMLTSRKANEAVQFKLAQLEQKSQIYRNELTATVDMDAQRDLLGSDHFDRSES